MKGYNQTQIILDENNDVMTYLPKTPMHDETADQFSQGAFVPINDNSYRTSQCFGVYLTMKVPLQPMTMKDVLSNLFDCNVELEVDIEELYVEMQVKLFDKDDQSIDFENHNHEIRVGQRLELRFASKSHPKSLQFFTILREFSKIKSIYGKNIKFYSPQLRLKENRYTVQDMHRLIMAHLKECVCQDNIDQPHRKIFFNHTHFDGIGKKHPITFVDC